jgi:hypothetical protein
MFSLQVKRQMCYITILSWWCVYNALKDCTASREKKMKGKKKEKCWLGICFEMNKEDAVRLLMRGNEFTLYKDLERESAKIVHSIQMWYKQAATTKPDSSNSLRKDQGECLCYANNPGPRKETEKYRMPLASITDVWIGMLVYSIFMFLTSLFACCF